MEPHTSRRRLLGLLAAGVPALTACASAPVTRVAVSPTVAFHGPHQAGIATPQQRVLQLVAFDLARGAGRTAVTRLLRRWSQAAAQLTSGRSAEPELTGLEPARLTITVGVGPELPAKAGLGPLPGLRRLAAFPGDRLDPARCDGDLVVQLCSDDPAVPPQVARVLSRLAEGVARMRWRQGGLHLTAADGLPRNLFGFKDGVVNPDPSQLGAHVWTPGGGTFMVVRRIRMDTDGFAALSVAEQEAAVGRRRGSGAPLSALRVGDEIDLFAKSPAGAYVIPSGAHVRRANPLAVDGARMLRRGYTYLDGADDQGLAFVSFQNTLDTFEAVQRRLATDTMMSFTRTVGSAAFYVLPGAAEGEHLGREL